MLRVLVAVPVGFAIQGWSFSSVLLGRRVIVFAPGLFVGRVVQSALFGELETCQGAAVPC